jgi:hypothetical protein
VEGLSPPCFHRLLLAQPLFLVSEIEVCIDEVIGNLESSVGWSEIEILLFYDFEC